MIPRLPRSALLALATMAATGVGCGRSRPAPDRPYALPVDVFADTGRTQTLPVSLRAPAAPPARVWLARVSPARLGTEDLPPPEATPETLAVSRPPPPALAVDEGLKPPVPRARTPL